MSTIGFCHGCDKKVPISGNPPFCTLCYSFFIETFHSPKVDSKMNVESALTAQTASSVVLTLPSYTGSIPIQISDQPTPPTSNNALKNITNTVDNFWKDKFDSTTGQIKNDQFDNQNLQKHNFFRKDKEKQEEDIICSICLDDWTNSGDHRLVSLKCGHLFGESCIRKWLTTTNKCSQCKAVNSIKDIRVIYAKSLKASNTKVIDIERQLRIDKEAEALQEKKLRIEFENKYKILKLEILQNKLDALELNSYFLSPSNKPPQYPEETLTTLAPILAFGQPQPECVNTIPSVMYQSLLLNMKIEDFYMKDPTCSCLSNNGHSIIVVTQYSVHEFNFDGSLICYHKLLINESLHNFPIKVALTQTQKLFLVTSSTCFLNVLSSTKLKIYSGSRDSRGIFERDIFLNGCIQSIEVNQVDEIVVLCLESGRRNTLIHLKQDGKILRRLLFPASQYVFSDFSLKDDKYFLCAKNQLRIINYSGTILSNFNISCGTNPGICLAPNNHVYLSFLKSNRFQIWDYDLDCVLKKKSSYPLSRVFDSKPQVLPDGRLAITVKREHALFIFENLQ